MSLKLYNTRTRSVEPFEPMAPPSVTIYVCGLTPSAEAHVGHARTYLFFDVLRRFLAHKGYAVRYVQNVTDIDDRSITEALASGRDWRTIVGNYYASFKASMEKLGVLPLDPGCEPRATEYVPQIVHMIEALIEGGHAYVAKDGVYYRVSRFPDYGKLANRNIGELEAGARIEVDEFKEDPLDFALWKFAKRGEPSWESPWGAGRPGWHIECSAMARELLGDQFDLHGGGADLIFPHHENEIAQSEPIIRKHPMAIFWSHGGVLLSEGRKMSKSFGNYEPLHQLLERHDPQAIRLLFLQTGYSKVMNFREDALAAAHATLQTLRQNYRLLNRFATSSQEQPHWPATVSDKMRNGDFHDFSDAVETALDDDVNTASALREVLSFAALAPAFEGHPKAAAAARDVLAYWLSILGIAPSEQWLVEPVVELPDDFLDCLKKQLNGSVVLGSVSSAHEAIEKVLEVRQKARTERRWSESDRLRDALAHCGVALEDTREGTTWTVAG
ncbi:MAG: cysteine--tRNA ligase [Candidatus Eremiobacteraeota bacterium]|nr:cysteine--tRNA ligase [Candidatus Eremiobacteraeota bacterium]